MNNKQQEIYINLDDSGKLSLKEKICVYGGIVFFSKDEKDRFITQYRSIINSIKCSYCKQEKNNCNKKCPEIKNSNIKPSDKRRIMNYLKKYFVIASIIKNEDVFDNIMKDKASKGRFLDYTLRRMIKSLINELIKLKIINPYEPLKLIINIDQQSTKSNGYYTLKDGLIEELIHGIQNFNYNKKIKPIFFSELDIHLTYQDSGKSYVVQASDLLAGTIRRININFINNNKILNNELNKFVDFKIFFP